MPAGRLEGFVLLPLGVDEEPIFKKTIFSMFTADIMKGTKVQTLGAVAGAWPVALVRGNYYTHAHR